MNTGEHCRGPEDGFLFGRGTGRAGRWHTPQRGKNAAGGTTAPRLLASDGVPLGPPELLQLAHPPDPLFAAHAAAYANIYRRGTW